MMFGRAIFSSVVLLGGCSLVTDLSGYAGSAPTNPTPEAGADATAEAAVDAGRDAGGGDAAGPFCVPNAHAFCDDFDRGGQLDAWERIVDPLGSVSVSTLRAVSAPSSLLSTVPRRSAFEPFAQASLDKSFDGWRRVVVELDVFVEAPSFQANDVNAGIFVLSFTSSAGDHGLALSVGSDYTTLGNPGVSVNGAPLVMDAWQHARFDFDPAGQVAGSVGLAKWQQTFSPLVKGAAPSMHLQIGVNGYNRPAPEFRVFYDNVTVDFP